MPVPRLSQSAEAARAAAAQAEFNEKKWVWVPDEKEGYLAGFVNKEEDDVGEVVMASGGEIRKVPLYTLNKMNPPKFDRVEDIADLTFLNEASVVHNLRLRYGSGSIYTYSGLFLVAINPYQSLPLYSDAIIQQYRSKRRDENPPHIFAVAERAWINMGEERENQSILITGESGAGKTESTKKVIQYLAAIATDTHAPGTSHSRSPTLTGSTSFSSMPSVGLPRSSSFKRGANASSSVSSPNGSHLTAKGRLGLLERQILQANPILEAFGNAQTQRNNNSSRFGKFIRITFAPDGSIAGANIDWYLLEKSRVVVRSEAERSFHIFYQLMAGAGSLKDKLLLGGGIEDYEYLNKSRREVDGVDDKEEWNALKAALDVVGFTPAEQFDLFRIVAAILHIGNIEITATRADDALMPDPSQAERVCHLLGVPVTEFTRGVLRPQVRAGREWVTQARTRQQALDELAALCKTLYEKSFGVLVDRLNQALDRPSSKSTFIGVLDIAGFEIFEVNTYEQLLINYTNERLQQFFNHHMFVLEQEEYAREGIKWEYVNFGLDLQPTIDLIEASGGSNGGPIGILSCLDEECIMPKATDLTFTEKLHGLWPVSGAPEDKYFPSRFEQGFMIRHYAADVQYRTDGWLEKNKDPLNDNLTRILATSSERYVAGLFADYGDVLPPGNGPVGFSLKKRGTKKGAFRTVAQRHKEQLASLMAQLQATQPHFVRCIVPNNHKKPGRVDVPLVLDQLRCNGVLEGIRIARLGYPNRLPFVEFRQRYEVLTPGIIPRGYMDGREACRRIVAALELDEALFKIGTSKIFFKAGVLAELEERRDLLLYGIFSKIQAAARTWSSRRQMKKILNRAMAIRTIQRNARVYGELRDWPWWQLYTKVRPLLAATRSDDELRKKEAELALIRERAERDKQEREALESLKMTLESEKRRVEDALEAERALTLDKDALLERSKKREAELAEEVSQLQEEVDELDSHLTRAMALQKETEEKYSELKHAFNEAAEHLIRLETDNKQQSSRETDLSSQLTATSEELVSLRTTHTQLQKVSDDLKNLALQRKEDLERLRDRSELTIKELEGKLEIEQRNKDLVKTKTDTLEEDARHAKEQLAEMARTASEYSSMIQKKEERILLLNQELEDLQQQRRVDAKELAALQSDIDTLQAELSAEKKDRSRDAATNSKLQQELDELRTLMATKTTEESRRNEAEKSREAELAKLRSECQTLHQDLSESRQNALNAQSKLKLELDQASRELATLQGSQKAQLDQQESLKQQLQQSRASLSEQEKLRRSIESELLSVRSRQNESEKELAEVQKDKEALERQVAASQTKYHNVEDLMLQLERDKGSLERDLGTARKSLEEETTKRASIDKSLSAHKAEVTKLRDRNAKLDRELNQALTDLKNREWQVKQLESRQDKTIVEHVHVLEEAKRVTDRQLADAQLELQRQTAYIKSLENAKTRLAGEAEDLARETERERVEMRTREKTSKAQEERTTKALREVEKERHAKDVAELQARRMEGELQNARRQVEELSHQLSTAQKSKANLESELDRLADETHTSTTMAKLQQHYETRIADLEILLGQQESGSMLTNLKERIDRHHAEIRKMVLNGGSIPSTFQTRLLAELKSVDDELAQTGLPKPGHRAPSTSVRTFANLSSNRGTTPSAPPTPQKSSAPDKQVAALRQTVQVLEIRIAASERVRQHLESSLQAMTTELEHSDGSKHFLQEYRSRLSKENTRLKELLTEEADARKSAEDAQIDGVQAMWNKFNDTIAEERKNYARLEESRKALVVQQRTTEAELESQRAQVNELASSRKALHSELSVVGDQLVASKAEISDLRRQLQSRLREDQVSSTAASAAHSEMQAAIQSYQAKEKSYQEKLEAAEIARAKAARAEAQARRTLTELEKTNAMAQSDISAVDEKLAEYEQQIQALEAKLRGEAQSAAQLNTLNQRLAEELEDEKTQNQKFLDDTDFAVDQTRKKYQAELKSLSDELQAQRDTLVRSREDNRKLRADYDALQLHLNEVEAKYNESRVKKEKDRLQTKIDDLTRAFEASSAAQSEQQSQIVALHSQVRELRGVLDDVEADRALLQKARRALQAELEGVKLDHVDTSKMSSEREYQVLLLEKQDLERAIEEREDRIANAFERVKRAESYANDCQIELGKIRVDNSELDRLNANLQKQVKELNLRIVDLETKSLANSPRSIITRRADSRIEEITNQLQTRGSDSSRRVQPGDLDRQRLKFEEERQVYDQQIAELRKAMDALQTEENLLQSSKRKAELQAADYREKAASLEREVERLRSRLPNNGYGSPMNTPRK